MWPQDTAQVHTFAGGYRYVHRPAPTTCGSWRGAVMYNTYAKLRPNNARLPICIQHALLVPGSLFRKGGGDGAQGRGRRDHAPRGPKIRSQHGIPVRGSIACTVGSCLAFVICDAQKRREGTGKASWIGCWGSSILSERSRSCADYIPGAEQFPHAEKIRRVRWVCDWGS